MPYFPEEDSVSRTLEEIFVRLPPITDACLIPMPALPPKPDRSERRQWLTPPSIVIGNKRLSVLLLRKLTVLPNVRFAVTN